MCWAFFLSSKLSTVLQIAYNIIFPENKHPEKGPMWKKSFEWTKCKPWALTFKISVKLSLKLMHSNAVSIVFTYSFYVSSTNKLAMAFTGVSLSLDVGAPISESSWAENYT